MLTEPPHRKINRDRTIVRPHGLTNVMHEWWVAARKVLIDLGATSPDNSVHLSSLRDLVPYTPGRADSTHPNPASGITTAIRRGTNRHYGVKVINAHRVYLLWVAR